MHINIIKLYHKIYYNNYNKVSNFQICNASHNNKVIKINLILNKIKKPIKNYNKNNINLT